VRSNAGGGYVYSLNVGLDNAIRHEDIAAQPALAFADSTESSEKEITDDWCTG